MNGSSTGRRLMIILDEDTTVHHKPVYTQIVQRAHDAGLAGASVFRGIEGFGASRRLHTSRILSLAQNLPVMIVIVDTEAAIERFLPQLDEFDFGGVIALDDVEMVSPGGQLP